MGRKGDSKINISHWFSVFVDDLAYCNYIDISDVGTDIGVIVSKSKDETIPLIVPIGVNLKDSLYAGKTGTQEVEIIKASGDIVVVINFTHFHVNKNEMVNMFQTHVGLVI